MNFKMGGAPLSNFCLRPPGTSFTLTKSKFWSKPGGGAPPGPHPPGSAPDKKRGADKFLPMLSEGG